MRFYMAPLEGITTYIYRNAYARYFQPMDQYFAPFIVASEQRTMSGRESGDLLPERNQGITLIPQILTNNSAAFVKTARMIQHMGYEEINLNLGCPSGTVVAKGKGAGFLAEPEKLDHFLEEIFAWGEMAVSVKTRIGKYDPEEFTELLAIFNKYPIRELVIHPRVQQDFYGNRPHMEVFAGAMKTSRNPLCYNGDIFTLEDYVNLKTSFPDLKAVMLGRGVLSNPWLAGQIRNWENEQQGMREVQGSQSIRESQSIQDSQSIRESQGIQDSQNIQSTQDIQRNSESIELKNSKGYKKECKKEREKEALSDVSLFREFHNQLLTDYQKALSGDRNVLFKMKELWVYFLPLFEDAEKEGKKIRKTQKVTEYQSVVEGLLSSGRFRTG